MKLPQFTLCCLTAFALGMFLETVVLATPNDNLSVSVCQIPEQAEEIVDSMSTNEIITLVIKGQNEFTLTQDEMELIAKIVHAEAGNQDQIGKRLVVDVILNRMVDEKFPSTVGGVIYQSGQFTKPAGYYTEDDMEAVVLECERRIDTEILWFRAGSFHKFGTPAYQHADHYFSKK